MRFREVSVRDATDTFIPTRRNPSTQIRRGLNVKSDLIAPCGMNCATCLGHLRERNRCLGCRKVDVGKSISRTRCTIRNCPVLRERRMKYCSNACDKYPCRRLRSLDKRYRTRYGMSMIENLENIRKSGIRDFVRDEKVRWKCSGCGRVICVHRDSCVWCGAVREHKA